MVKRSKLLKVSIFIAGFIMCVGATGCSGANKSKELDSSNVTLITEVLPSGEVGYAIVCDYGANIDASKLSPESFTVESTSGDKTEARTITKVYTNDSITTSDSSKAGRYVVIELDPKDSNASTTSFDAQKFLNIRNQLKYTVTQKTDITTSDNATFKASDKKIANSKVITPIADDFKKLSFKDGTGNSLNYRFFEPKTEENKKYPLVLFLHGSGERGNDNELQLIDGGALVWAKPEEQAKNPCYVIAPQAPVAEVLNTYWVIQPTYDLVVNLVKDAMKKYPIDPDRIYVTGMSNGGTGTWNIVENNPDLFAAAVPICGWTNTSPTEATQALDSSSAKYTPVDAADVQVLKNIPIWAFTAEDDPLVDVRNSREMVEAIKKAGGNLINYTEYPDGIVKPIGHFSWIIAYQDKDMIDWLFKQSKK